jgi:hypothetical protein
MSSPEHWEWVTHGPIRMVPVNNFKSGYLKVTYADEKSASSSLEGSIRPNSHPENLPSPRAGMTGAFIRTNCPDHRLVKLLQDSRRSSPEVLQDFQDTERDLRAVLQVSQKAEHPSLGNFGFPKKTEQASLACLRSPKSTERGSLGCLGCSQNAERASFACLWSSQSAERTSFVRL